MLLSEFRDKAKQGGWWDKENVSTDEQMLLDVKAWQAVGKSEGWSQNRESELHALDDVIDWFYYQHKMIDALAEGKSVEDFIKTL